MKEVKIGVGIIIFLVYIWFIGEAFAHINVYLAFALIGVLILGGVYLIRTKFIK